MVQWGCIRCPDICEIYDCVVEGLTEYLPVSSTGHLLLAQRAMGIIGQASGSPREYDHSKDAADAYAICIQAGAIMAVFELYSRRMKQMALGLMGKDRDGLRMARNIAVAFLPAAVIGLLNGIIKEYLFGPWSVIAAWFVGGVLILSVKWMVSYLNKHGLAVFGYYRIALAAVVAILILTDIL